jgi:hypothetical protein
MQKDAIRDEMEYNQRDYKHHIEKAERMDTLAKTAGVVEDAADIGVETISHMTGPTGEMIKEGYDAARI